MALIPLGLPLATTNDWPAWKYGIMSTDASRSFVMFWSETTMSHLPPVTAAMIVSNTEFWISTLSPSRFAISVAMSMSEPVGLPWASKNSSGGYGMSEQTTSLPAKIS